MEKTYSFPFHLTKTYFVCVAMLKDITARHKTREVTNNILFNIIMLR